MGWGSCVSGVVGFLRAGYPNGAPVTGYVPLLALLPRRVSDAEVTTITRKLLAPQRRPADRWDIDRIDVGVEITRVTAELPSPGDIERVQHRLIAADASDT